MFNLVGELSQINLHDFHFQRSHNSHCPVKYADFFPQVQWDWPAAVLVFSYSKGAAMSEWVIKSM